MCPQIGIQALYLAYQLFIWPLADTFYQVQELITVFAQLMLLVCFTNMMRDGNYSRTLEATVVGVQLQCWQATWHTLPTHRLLIYLPFAHWSHRL
jgi:hypothetical protein